MSRPPHRSRDGSLPPGGKVRGARCAPVSAPARPFEKCASHAGDGRDVR